MGMLEYAIEHSETEMERTIWRHSSFALQLRPIPVRPRNIDYFGRLPYLPEPYSSLWADVDRYTSQLREKAEIEQQAGFAARTQCGLTPEEPRPYSTSINPSTSLNGAPPNLEETRALIVAVIA